MFQRPLTVQESTPGCYCARNLSMRSDDILYDINKTNAIKRIYLDNYLLIMFSNKILFPIIISTTEINWIENFLMWILL